MSIIGFEVSRRCLDPHSARGEPRRVPSIGPAFTTLRARAARISADGVELPLVVYGSQTPGRAAPSRRCAERRPARGAARGCRIRTAGCCRVRPSCTGSMWCSSQSWEKRHAHTKRIAEGRCGPAVGVGAREPRSRPRGGGVDAGSAPDARGRHAGRRCARAARRRGQGRHPADPRMVGTQRPDSSRGGGVRQARSCRARRRPLWREVGDIARRRAQSHAGGRRRPRDPDPGRVGGLAARPRRLDRQGCDHRLVLRRRLVPQRVPSRHPSTRPSCTTGT